MRLTPTDIYQREFKRAFRGLDQEDVEDFLDQVAEDYEELTNESSTYKQQVETLEEQLRQFDNTEVVSDMVQDAKDKINKKLRDADNRAVEIIGKAQEEAEQIKEEASSEAKRINQEAMDHVEEMGLQGNSDPGEATEIILKANEDANIIKQKAQEEAKEIISKAHKESEEIVSEAREKTSIFETEKDSEDASEIIENAKEEANKIIQEARSQADDIVSNTKAPLSQAEKVMEKPDRASMQHESEIILDEIKSKAYNIIEKARIQEMEAKREIARLKNQRERYLMGYRELLSRQIRTTEDEVEESL